MLIQPVSSQFYHCFITVSPEGTSLKSAAAGVAPTLSCIDDYIRADKMQGMSVMIMDVSFDARCNSDCKKNCGLFLSCNQINDECSLTEPVKEEMYKCYPNARRAHLKNGRNFSYLSRADKGNLVLQVENVFPCALSI